MNVKSIAFVVYGVTNIPRAKKIYEGVLGLKQSSFWGDDNGGMIEYEIGTEHTLAIGSGAPTFKPGPNGGCVALEVEDFEGMIKILKDNEISFVLESTESSVCFMACVTDPDGNQIMIHKRKTA